MGAHPTPRTPPDPADGHTKARVLERFQNREEQYWGSVGPSRPGDLQGFDRSLMEAAGDAEGLEGAGLSFPCERIGVEL